MSRNITLRLDDETIRRARVAAASRDQSLSKWVAELIERELGKDLASVRSWDRMATVMSVGFDLGGAPLSRERLHER